MSEPTPSIKKPVDATQTEAWFALQKHRNADFTQSDLLKTWFAQDPTRVEKLSFYRK